MSGELLHELWNLAAVASLLVGFPLLVWACTRPEAPRCRVCGMTLGRIDGFYWCAVCERNGGRVGDDR